MKMKLRANIIIASTVLFTSVCFVSCKKESTNENIKEDDVITYSSESAEAEASFADLQDIAMTAAEEEAMESAGRGTTAAREGDIRIFIFAKLRLRIGPCANIDVSPADNSYPKTITVNFQNGCASPNGQVRKGKIVMHLTAPIYEPGAVLTVTFSEYHLNRLRVEGTKVITNLSANGVARFSVQVTGASVKLPNGKGYTYESLKEIFQVAGAATAELADDIYEIEGASKTIFNNGVSVTMDITDNLIKKFSCPWISEGTVAIKVNNTDLLLDYGFPGNGDCDKKALLTWNNNLNQHVVVLP